MGLGISELKCYRFINEDGEGQIIFGVWEEFIGKTISVYGGYTDDCGNHHIDSLSIRIL